MANRRHWGQQVVGVTLGYHNLTGTPTSTSGSSFTCEGRFFNFAYGPTYGAEGLTYTSWGSSASPEVTRA